MFLVSLFLIGCPAKVQKEKSPFTYLGKPIHPACIETLYQSKNNRLDLPTFLAGLDIRDWEERPGWLIAEYKEDVETGRTPFFAYKLLANVQDRFLLLIRYNGGGTGTFDNILVIQKTKDQLFLLKALGEGDRCTGGIFEEKMIGNDFYYSRNLTPIDIIRLATETKIDLTAYEDLEASARSCFGVAHYKYDLVDDKNELLTINLDEEKQDEEGWTDRYQAQSCFNKIYNSYLKAKKTQLSLKDLNEFAKKFRDECLKKASSALR
jgi:hypothetical protein